MELKESSRWPKRTKTVWNGEKSMTGGRGGSHKKHKLAPGWPEEAQQEASEPVHFPTQEHRGDIGLCSTPAQQHRGR